MNVKFAWHTILIVTFLALLLPFFSSLAYATLPKIRFPSGITVTIPKGMKVHFGDSYVSTTGTAMHITKWFESNWLNYTVDGASSQIIYNGTDPSFVYIDGTNKTVGDGWTTASGLVTLIATSTVQIEWAIPSTPSTPSGSHSRTSSNFDVLFKVTLNGNPLENCQIRISTTTYQEYIGTYMTDSNGEATAYLAIGTYDYSATYQEKRVTDTFQHIEEETITINLGTGQTTQYPTLDKSQWIKIGIGLMVIVAAVFAVTAITKKRRW